MSEYLQRTRKIRSDDKQRIVLEEDKSRVVLAGPGAGKTYLLTTKIAKLLLENSVRSPHKIACLTYSRLLKTQLQFDLEKLGVLDDDRIFVGTVHAFCISEVILPFKILYQIKIPDPLRIASWPEMLDTLEMALQQQDKTMPSGKWDQGNLMRDLSKYRKLYLDYQIEHYPEAQTNIPDLNWLQLANDYIQILLEGSVDSPSVDFVEIELLTLQLIQQHELVQKSLAAKYTWWTIDEYQDLGRPFHKMILSLLENTDIRVLAIGDRNQCIFEDVQGSKPEYIGELAQKIERRDGNPQVELEMNYRSTQEIIGLSQIILGKDLSYRSGSDMAGQYNAIKLEESYYDRRLLLRLLNHLVNEDGINLNQIAILNSRRNGINSIARMLANADWPYSLDKDPEYKQTELTEWIEQLAKWCVSGISKPHLSQVALFWNELNEYYYANTMIKNEFELTRELFDTLYPLQNPQLNLRVWFNQIVDNLRLGRLVEKYQEIRPDDVLAFNDLRQAIQEKRRLSSWNLSQFAKFGDRIQLTTLHSSKGSQYEAVILSDFDGIPWKQNQHPTELERRLMYVALTRAKTRLYLMYKNVSAFFVEQITQEAPDALRFFGYNNCDVYVNRDV